MHGWLGVVGTKDGRVVPQWPAVLAAGAIMTLVFWCLPIVDILFLKWYSASDCLVLLVEYASVVFVYAYYFSMALKGRPSPAVWDRHRRGCGSAVEGGGTDLGSAMVNLSRRFRFIAVGAKGGVVLRWRAVVLGWAVLSLASWAFPVLDCLLITRRSLRVYYAMIPLYATAVLTYAYFVAVLKQLSPERGR